MANFLENGTSSHSSFRWDGYIPESVTDEDQFFMKMAEICPKYNKDHNIKSGRFRVCIYERNEESIPHVHIYYEHKESKNHGNNKTVAYVRLDKAEYAPQHDKETKILNSSEKKALIDFFTTKIPNRYSKDKNNEFYLITCWEEAVDRWIQQYDDAEKFFEVDEKTGRFIMPDYSKL